MGTDSGAVAVVAASADPILDELIDALVRARQTEEAMATSLQEARTYLGDRQRACQSAQEVTRAALSDLRRFIDRRAGLPESYREGEW